MKYNNAPIILETREIELPRTSGPIRLRISAVSVGVRRDYDAVFPKPNPPAIITETKTGRKSETNWDDPKWRKDIEEREYLQNIYIVYRVLTNDANLVFDNKPTDLASLRALALEFSESGFSEGDLLLILREALKASNVTQEEIESVKKVF